MAQGKSPRNPLAFASVLCPGRCLASQPIHLGSEVEQYPSDSSRYTPRKEARILLSSPGFLPTRSCLRSHLRSRLRFRLRSRLRSRLHESPNKRKANENDGRQAAIYFDSVAVYFYC